MQSRFYLFPPFKLIYAVSLFININIYAIR